MVPTIDHVLGQDDVIRRFRVALEASWNDGSRLPHMLFTGGPGLGKTMLAHLAAKELGVNLHERLAQVVNTPGSLNGLLLQAKDKDVVFLDEVHELLPSTQTLLYQSMEGRHISVRASNERTLTMPLRDLSVIAATTDEYKLLGPLRDRFKIILPFTTYDDESLAKIVGQRAQLTGIQIDNGVAQEISKRSKGTPRLGIRLLESCHRYARSRGDENITMDHFEATVALDNLDTLGLGPDEQRFIKFLMKRRGEPVRLFSIEAAIGVHRRTIADVIEPYLLRKGLIERMPQGRVITEQGIRHVQDAKQVQPAREASS